MRKLLDGLEVCGRFRMNWDQLYIERGVEPHLVTESSILQQVTSPQHVDHCALFKKTLVQESPKGANGKNAGTADAAGSDKKTLREPTAGEAGTAGSRSRSLQSS